MLVSGYNNIILLPNCTLLYYVFSGPLSLCAYVPEIKFNNCGIRHVTVPIATRVSIANVRHIGLSNICVINLVYFKMQV